MMIFYKLYQIFMIFCNLWYKMSQNSVGSESYLSDEDINFLI